VLNPSFMQSNDKISPSPPRSDLEVMDEFDIPWVVAWKGRGESGRSEVV